MNASRRWLEEFLRQPLDARDVADRLGMLGAPADEIPTIGADLDESAVGLIWTVEPQPMPTSCASPRSKMAAALCMPWCAAHPT